MHKEKVPDLREMWLQLARNICTQCDDTRIRKVQTNL